MEATTDTTTSRPASPIVRHKASTRIWHWLSAVLLTILLMSGMNIFNAHPRLYWGHYGADPDPAWLEIGAAGDHGYLRVADWQVDTTGFLGRWTDSKGNAVGTAFPGGVTLPPHYDLAGARRWHISAAWVFALGTLGFAILSLLNGHARKDLWPRRRDLSPRQFAADCRQHFRPWRIPAGSPYNTLQRLAYLGVTAVLFPVIIFSGLTMSPWADAVFPFLIDMFGGRQSARSVHFIAAVLLVGFVVIHLLMVILSRPLSQIRCMLTGRVRTSPKAEQ